MKITLQIRYIPKNCRKCAIYLCNNKIMQQLEYLRRLLLQVFNIQMIETKVFRDNLIINSREQRDYFDFICLSWFIYSPWIICLSSATALSVCYTEYSTQSESKVCAYDKFASKVLLEFRWVHVWRNLHKQELKRMWHKLSNQSIATMSKDIFYVLT